MRDHLTIDFETRSPLDLTKVGPYQYTNSPHTRVLCLAADYQGNQSVIFETCFWDLPLWLQNALEDDTVLIHAHNAQFERLVIQNLLYDWPRIDPSRFRCSAARARRLALPGALDKAGAALGLDTQKSQEGKTIMRRLMKPKPIGGYTSQGHVYDDTPEKLIKLGDYCLQDVRAEIAIDDATFPLPESELRLYQLTERINDRGVRIDVPLVKRLLWRANEAIEELNDELREITNGAVKKLTDVAKLKAWVQDETGHVLATLRKEDMEGLLIEADRLGLPPHVKDALKIRQEGAKSSVAKLMAILNRVSEDGILRGAFLFHGASTGRYTSVGVQLQNLVRDTHKDFDKEIKELNLFTLTDISKTLRQVFIPRKEHVFVDADYNAIEARGVGWLAGAEGLLRIYRRGGDPYCEMGTTIYGFDVTKEDTAERFVGKQTILGCGYGMGAPKFETQCEKFGQVVSSAIAKKAVYTYRDEFSEIPDLWKDIERAAMSAVRNGKIYSAANGKIKFRVKDGYLQMKLPNGRRLFYKSPRIVQEVKFDREQDVLSFMAQHSITKQWVRETTWGGKLTENAVQAICRDLLFEAMQRIEELHDIPVVLSVHDQLVCEVPNDEATWAKEIVKEEMEYVPDWADGFPIFAEPKIAERFGK